MRPRAARQMAACVRGAAPAHLCRAARFSTRGPYREMDTSSPCRFREVDTALAGLGLFGSISVLGYVESFTGVPLFAPPMLASGIIFFIFPRPPEPKGFLSGTFCSSTLSLAALAVLSPVLPPVAAHGAAASVLLMWYKATGSCFPPAAVLAGTLAATSASASASFESAATFLACPWLAGHVWMYGCAHALSIVRSRARITLTKAALVGKTDEELGRIFEQFDTSGDGALDAHELKIALRVVIGADLLHADCEALVEGADTNGTGTVNFDEFRAICKKF